MEGEGRPIGLGPTLRLDRITGAVAVIGFTGLVAISFLTFWDGSARYAGLPRLFGFSDYGEAIYPIVIATCFPAALLRGTNVSVTVLGKLLGRRGTAWLEVFAALVTLGFFAVLVWQFVLYTSELGGRTTRTGVLRLAPFWWAATTIMAVCLPVQAWVVWLRLRAAVTGRTPAVAVLSHGGQGG